MIAQNAINYDTEILSRYFFSRKEFSLLFFLLLYHFLQLYVTICDYSSHTRHGIQQCAHSTNHHRVRHNASIILKQPVAGCALPLGIRDNTATCPGEKRGRKGEGKRQKEKKKIESDCTRVPIILEILRRDGAIYLRRISERVQQNTIGETGQRRVKKWRRRRRRKRRVDGGGRGRGGHRGDGGGGKRGKRRGSFYKKSGRERGPFRRRDRRGGTGENGGERRRTGVASERWRGGVTAREADEAGEGGRPRR